MRSERNRYFIFPSVDYEPDDLIQLGQLIENLYHPDEHIAPPVIQPAGAVHVFHEKDWSLGITVEASRQATNSYENSWTAAQLETVFLQLGGAGESDYVTSSVQNARVQKYLSREGFFRKSILKRQELYMISGIKIARRPGQSTIEGESSTPDHDFLGRLQSA
ncbi:hypothetical protein CMEL01_08009 [Colletotrichum melonis]|uniref:Uncharacterized protein n=1 Tax=Colletotrichum melonis TaxID=1209925 RepID=A0AAI9XG12_9PEZI|nr:hypothetical protein CMEL01_08009 [Colletotrichum melonis]